MNAEARRAWELMEKIGVCMLVQSGEEIRARPMYPHFRRAAGRIDFLTDVRQHTDRELQQDLPVCLAFSDPNVQRFVAVTGRAHLVDERSEIKALWSTPAKAWWEDPDDPNLRVLVVMPSAAEYWEGPGKLIEYVRMAAAAVVGRKPDPAEGIKVKL